MAVTVTYNFVNPALLPASAGYITGTTPPTAFQATQVSRIGALVNFGADSDTTATVTHNWSFSASQLSNLQLVVILTPQTIGTAAGFYSVQLTNANTITITKGVTSAGSGETTFMVNMLYPNSLIE